MSTANFRIPIPVFDKRFWQDDYNEAFTIIDALLARYISVNDLQGLWANSTDYTEDQTVVDPLTGLLYVCAVDHTSSASPTTFAEDREDNPTYWTNITVQNRFRGAWVTATAYLVGDFVTSGNKYAVCTVGHTSGATFATDEATKWEVLIDLTDDLAYIADALVDVADALASLTLPSVTGQALKILRVNAGGTAYELTNSPTLSSVATTGNATIGGDANITGAMNAASSTVTTSNATNYNIGSDDLLFQVVMHSKVFG